jgi:hypothetical protein
MSAKILKEKSLNQTNRRFRFTQRRKEVKTLNFCSLCAFVKFTIAGSLHLFSQANQLEKAICL